MRLLRTLDTVSPAGCGSDASLAYSVASTSKLQRSKQDLQSRRYLGDKVSDWVGFAHLLAGRLTKGPIRFEHVRWYKVVFLHLSISVCSSRLRGWQLTSSSENLVLISQIHVRPQNIPTIVRPLPPQHVLYCNWFPTAHAQSFAVLFSICNLMPTSPLVKNVAGVHAPWSNRTRIS